MAPNSLCCCRVSKDFARLTSHSKQRLPSLSWTNCYGHAVLPRLRGTCSHCPCLSVRVCLSQAGVVSKRLDESRWLLESGLSSVYPTLFFLFFSVLWCTLAYCVYVLKVASIDGLMIFLVALHCTVFVVNLLFCCVLGKPIFFSLSHCIISKFGYGVSQKVTTLSSETLSKLGTFPASMFVCKLHSTH